MRHFTRKGIAAYNHQSGEFRAKTKAGNHNAWRSTHEQNTTWSRRWTRTMFRLRLP